MCAPLKRHQTTGENAKKCFQIKKSFFFFSNVTLFTAGQNRAQLSPRQFRTMGWSLYLWNTFSRQNRAFSTFKLDWVTTLTTLMAPCIAEHFQYLLNWQILVKMNILYCFKRCSVHFWLVVVADNGCDKAVFVGLNKILMVTMNRTCHSWGWFPKLPAFLTPSPHNTTFFCTKLILCLISSKSVNYFALGLFFLLQITLVVPNC